MSHYIDKLPEEAIQIPDTLNWITPNGQVFGQETRKIFNKKLNQYTKHKYYGKYFIYSSFVNNHNGYVYVPIKTLNKNTNKYEIRQKRLHILIAQMFIENPNNYCIVGHRNNIKTDNRIDNLYWTTIKENTKKAFDDKLIVQKKGYEDSQSFPVVMFDTYTNKELNRYGSVSIASKETGINKTTILRQCKYKKPNRKPYYFRFQSDTSILLPTIIIEYDFQTDEIINKYLTCAEASRKTNIPQSTIESQCKLNKKPKLTKYKTYFQYNK